MSEGAQPIHLSQVCKLSHESLRKWPCCLCNRSLPQFYNTSCTSNCLLCLPPPTIRSLPWLLLTFWTSDELPNFWSNLFPEMFLYLKICNFSQNTPLEQSPGLAICYPGSVKGLRFNTYCTCHDNTRHFPPTMQERIQTSCGMCKTSTQPWEPSRHGYQEEKSYFCWLAGIDGTI